MFDLATASALGISVAAAPGRDRTDRPREKELAVAARDRIDGHDPGRRRSRTSRRRGSWGRVLGVGRAGRALERENLTQDKADRKPAEVGLPVRGGYALYPEAPTFMTVSKDELFSTADVVSSHYVLSERSRGIVGKMELARMKDSALLVNTSRGVI
ncbi:hypothetical protein Daesc_005852 [Daldinia eschscholtzii]|uniref:D-isomer specific 2-hydroxyacid dehydrogenase NAD-binding domain-containing protein n=1 Tax=Daldinia eschscholtzii TaxID=292717 RepID=A0AAX6MMC1_9PEZI